MLLACSSAKEQPGATNLTDLLSRAEDLRQAGNTDTAQYDRLLLDLEGLLAADSGFCTASTPREQALVTLSRYPDMECELRISEPREQLFVTTGFASPLRLIAECPANAPFLFEADSAAMTLSGEGMKFNKGYLDARMRISSANAVAARNTLQFKARYYAQSVLERLAAACSLPAPKGIRIFPSTYQVKAVPVEYSGQGQTVGLRSADAENSANADNDTSVLARLHFRRGSMQLTPETRKVLKNLRGLQKPLLIEGYSDLSGKDERLANLRARAVASFLEEYGGIRNAEIRWHESAHPDSGIGAIVKEKN